MSNIAEGFDRSGTAEFMQFLAMAKGSAAEVKRALYVAVDQGYLTEDAFAQLAAIAAQTGSVIGGLMAYLRKTTIKGSKFRRAGQNGLRETRNAELETA